MESFLFVFVVLARVNFSFPTVSPVIYDFAWRIDTLLNDLLDGLSANFDGNKVSKPIRRFRRHLLCMKLIIIQARYLSVPSHFAMLKIKAFSCVDRKKR